MHQLIDIYFAKVPCYEKKCKLAQKPDKLKGGRCLCCQKLKQNQSTIIKEFQIRAGYNVKNANMAKT